ncbi:hypothetical protein LH991_01230 [Schleiferilactobacillus harbinensis]|uniref:Uncharacterized protein n=1 Tax=Schleiferilactobacillus harbinensis DSM 16991 TaxID=1122147 RepID=A0A0R1XBK3_9LACO|nr:hypothetical protein [Schleiferilactobacillus harbinensis]KRM27551.1 hypothetical protein FC91_GL002467 [Schleiferilactobacillus harbinensis DSM 16991]QFR62708.1 hypothetical protein LH991_01230 [Schleiferilactobacillus harbinensis]
MIDDSEYVSGKEIARQWREMPHRKQADKIVLEMIDNNVSIEQVLDFTGFTDHEFARMLAGDGPYTQQQYDDLYAQIRAHQTPVK